MRSEFQRTVHQMAERLLTRKGYEVIDSSPKGRSVDLVARADDGSIVFVALKAKDAGDGDPAMPEEDLDRRALEQAAAEWLAAHDFGNVAVRFDSIALVVMGGSRAFARHHIDALR